MPEIRIQKQCVALTNPVDADSLGKPIGDLPEASDEWSASRARAAMGRNCRAALKSIMLLAGGLALTGFDQCAPPQDVTQPNILLIIADDVAYDHYGFAGHPVLQTPSIDSLAAQSVQWPETYVSSTCRPTHATLLTGLPVHWHGVGHIRGPTLGDFDTIADRLGDAGYSSYQAGKFWEEDPRNRGFTDFAEFTKRTGSAAIGRITIQPIFDFIDATEDPWFVWFSPIMPHSPHNAPDEYRIPYQGLGLDAATVEYFAMISWFDDVVGELLGGVDEDTVVIFLADNGFVQSAYSQIQEPNSKYSSYEDGIRTPLLIRHPAFSPHSRLGLAGAVDVVATILSIAGADRSDLPGRDLLYGELVSRSAFGSRWSLGLVDAPGILKERWVRLGDWKLVDVEEGDDRLHYLRSDPDEMVDLIDHPRGALMHSVLQSALERWWSQRPRPEAPG